MVVPRARVFSTAAPVSLVLLSLGAFQFGAALAKPLFGIVGAGGASALRLGMAALLMAIMVRPWRTPLDRRSAGFILAYGTGLAGLNFCFYMAIRTVPLGLTVAIEFLGPLTLAFVTSRRRSDVVWALLAALGIALLVPLRTVGSGLDPVGVGFALLSACCWTVYIVFGQKAGASVPSATATALGVAVAAVVVVPLGVASAGADLLRTDVLPLALAVAIISGVLPYMVEMAAMKRLPTRVFGVLMSLEPAFGALFGYLLLDQALTLTQGLALVSIMAASAGTTLTNSPTPLPQ